MTRYSIEDSVVDTDKATNQHAGNSHPTGYGHDRRTLYRSRKGRWYVEHDLSWTEDNRNLDYAEWVSPEDAVRFLLDETAMTEEAILEQHPGLKEALDRVAE